MLDRRLFNDDNRGLDEGIRDNLLVQSEFAILLEAIQSEVRKN